MWPQWKEQRSTQDFRSKRKQCFGSINLIKFFHKSRETLTGNVLPNSKQTHNSTYLCYKQLTMMEFYICTDTKTIRILIRFGHQYSQLISTNGDCFVSYIQKPYIISGWYIFFCQVRWPKYLYASKINVSDSFNLFR